LGGLIALAFVEGDEADKFLGEALFLEFDERGRGGV
jgi:hypothetical protein